MKKGKMVIAQTEDQIERNVREEAARGAADRAWAQFQSLRSFHIDVPLLRERLIIAAGIDRAVYRWFWLRYVDQVDWTKKSGYAFIGDWIDSDSTWVDATRDRLVIIASSTGNDERYTGGRGRRGKAKVGLLYERYDVVWLRKSGDIEHTGLVVENQDERWALAIRDQVELLLKRQALGPDDPMQRIVSLLEEKIMSVRGGEVVTWSRVDVAAVQWLLRYVEVLDGATK